MNKLKAILLILSTAILLSACQDPEKGKLDNRVIDYWNFKINKDFKSAYQFFSPGWKSNENVESYVLRMGQSKANWTGAKIIGKKCKTKSLCRVKVEIKYEYRFRGAIGELMTIDTSLSETWIMKDNTWYNLPIDKKLSKK